MTLIDDLAAHAERIRGDISALRSGIEGFETEIARRRQDIARLELEGVESMAAASLLTNLGFVIDRTDDGLPRVAIDHAQGDPVILEDQDGPLVWFGERP